MDLKILAEMPPWEWPEDAGELFLQILTDDTADADNRILAAELAGDATVINDALAQALMAVLQNKGESDDIRGVAAISLGPVLEYADEDGFDFPDDVLISEATFDNIRKLLRKLYLDASVPESIRRNILEASIRSPQDWHKDAVRAAWKSEDDNWNLTAVFSMRWISGFEQQILDALDSDNEDIHYHAVCAAGNWEVDAAWPHISGIVRNPQADKELLLAAIESAACIRPEMAGELLMDLADSEDEEIVETVHEALAMARGLSEDGFDEWDEDDEWD